MTAATAVLRQAAAQGKRDSDCRFLTESLSNLDSVLLTCSNPIFGASIGGTPTVPVLLWLKFFKSLPLPRPSGELGPGSLFHVRPDGRKRLPMSKKRRRTHTQPATARRASALALPRSSMTNRLLAALSLADYARVSKSLQTVPLILKDVLQRPGDPIYDVYFPGGGFCSILTVLKDRSMVEIATVGREGMVGISAVLDGGLPSSSLTMVQAASETCYRMPIEAFRREMDKRGRFAALVSRYANAYIGFVMQSTACNAKHSVEQRLARWLLLAQDRVGRDEFSLTQEFVAMMLGASRPTVTVVAGALQQAKLITYRRGMVRILNRVKLEAVSCECYRVTTELLSEVTDE